MHEWRKGAEGEVYIVRYADDLVIACEHERDGRALLELLDGRLRSHGLKLNRDKTRLIRFGRRWTREGGSRPETFDFLGFTHIAGKDRQGHYLVRRKTSRKRLNRSLKAISEWCKKNRHAPLRWQWEELSLKLRGHYNYYGVRGNFESLKRFWYRVWRHWWRALLRRSEKANKYRLRRLVTELFVLPKPKIMHPEGWFGLNPGYLLGRAGCGNTARPDL